MEKEKPKTKVVRKFLISMKILQKHLKADHNKDQVIYTNPSGNETGSIIN